MAQGGWQALKRRIKSVQNTRQITRAMKMVAGAKLRKAETQAKQAREYFDAMLAITRRAVELGPSDHPLLAEREVRRAGFLVVTADRGLAGPYNTNVLREAMRAMAQTGLDREHLKVFAVGRKGRDFLAYRGFRVVEEAVDLGDDPTFHQARLVVEPVFRYFLDEEIDAVYLVYTRYINAMSYRPTTLRLLPVPREELEQGRQLVGYEFEPSSTDVYDVLIPRYIQTMMYGALLEAKASEHGSRMVAMDSASKNADELIRRLILIRNRMRQAAITKEIAELVGAADALR
ncbi:ATP synthase subunit gamma [Candidatus Hydrogenisulfobacillus filiaventi]|uniref:ATP synthase gamma chain n=1 Tax=Candidatus Hydrogenisulfobacillus filiaventi TaxID=2707344 RepID=A0A6F8ZES3_9FIRM|nr:ATP synthase F1 subunit gamma [Bacillota bacterium]CAB1128143.1 ATP synthase subunit gamma [Candidatus Hydrogenisulfobacillus filiaventi]